MREALENGMPFEISTGANPGSTAVTIAGLSTSTLAQAFAVAAVLALWVAPSAPAQSAQPAQGSSQSTASSKNSSQTAQPADSNAPQMVDQSAPAADSLAEAARKAKAAKAKSGDGSAQASASTATKVYSNENMSSLSSHGVSFVGGSGSSSGSSNDSADSSDGSSSNPAGSQAGNGSGAAGGKSDESYWRGRAQAIRNQMADIDRQIERVQDDIAKNGAVSVDPSSGARQGVIIVQDRNAEIKSLQDKKADMENSLEQLAEEGRKAGADSGWFR